MDDRNRLVRSAVAPLRVVRDRRRIAESREPGLATEAVKWTREPRVFHASTIHTDKLQIDSPTGDLNGRSPSA
ncbi:hypothetical protein GCM10010533_31610 [Mycolicibacterium pallens]